MWSMNGRYSRPLTNEVLAKTFFSSSVRAAPPFGLETERSGEPGADCGASLRLRPSMPSGGTTRADEDPVANVVVAAGG